MSEIKEWFSNSSIGKELNSQPRLQWLLIFILVLICVSLLKSIYDNNQEITKNVSSLASTHSRLSALENTEISNELINTARDISDELLSQIPSVTSSSIAEASILSQLESSLQSIVSRQRLSLLGTDNIYLGDRNAWSIRIKIDGQLSEDNLVNFLQIVSPTSIHLRLASLTYAPKRSDSMSAVLDVLYLEDAADG